MLCSPCKLDWHEYDVFPNKLKEIFVEEEVDKCPCPCHIDPRWRDPR